ncbi:hypothetical protein T492DRAFT_862649 [Pavlovales sp. CCMP2436]|nr:hypothetical protein T492DRAFT_862649 [Pavlovales sp. CCMP2436]
MVAAISGQPPPLFDIAAASRRLRALTATLRDEASQIAAGQAALEAVRDARADLAQAEGAIEFVSSKELRAQNKVTEELHAQALADYNEAQAEADELSTEAGADIAIIAEAQEAAFASSQRQLSTALAAIDAADDAAACETALRFSGGGAFGLAGVTDEQRAEVRPSLCVVLC